MKQYIRGKKNSIDVDDPKSSVKDWRELRFPVLEMFYWRRIVFDEFHELETFDSAQQNSLQHLRSHYRWGLTGTPPLDSIRGPIFMSSLFRVDLMGCLPSCKNSYNSISTDEAVLKSWDQDQLLSDEC